MTAKLIPFPARQTARNQALASLYAVESALLRAGLGYRIGHGTSDEGDPWIAQTGPSGEFIAHVAYIDGEFVADTPAFTKAVRGRDIRPLVDRLLQGLRDLGEERRSILDNSVIVVAIGLAAAAVHLANQGTSGWQPIQPDHLAELPQHFTVPEALLLETSARLVKAAQDSHLLDLLQPPQTQSHVPEHQDTHVVVIAPPAPVSEALPHNALPTFAHEPAANLALQFSAPTQTNPISISDGPADVPMFISVPQLDGFFSNQQEQPPQVQRSEPQPTTHASDDATSAEVIDVGFHLRDITATEDLHHEITVRGVGLDVDQTFTFQDGSSIHIIGVAQEPPQH